MKLAIMRQKNKTDTIFLAKFIKDEFLSKDSVQHICKALSYEVGNICVVHNAQIGELYNV